MTVIGMTFARGGSVGVHRKNVRMVAGKPLIVWTIEQAKLCSELDDYIVVSDDLEIRSIAMENGVYALEEPTSDGTHPLIEKIQWALLELDDDYDIIADIRCTNALKTHDDIDNCIALLNITGCDVVCGVTKMVDHHPSRLKQMLDDGRLVDVWPEPESGLRQDLKPPVRGYEMPLERSINIDSELDLIVTEAVLNERIAGKSSHSA
jgi:CMP-N,N'-diacetyllegionaminic acid synthase